MRHLVRAIAFGVFGMAVLSGQVLALEACPAGKEGKSPFQAPTAPNGTEFTNILGVMDLSKETVMLKDHTLRIRTVTVSPGGIIPLHNHADRPAFFFMKNGSLTLFRQDCTVPQVLKEGDVSPEGKGTVHWARNDGKEFAILLVTDVVHTPSMDKEKKEHM